MANQTQIPVIIDPNPAIVQSQQNTNKVFKNLTNQITSLQTSLNEMTILGEIKFYPGTLAQFQATAGTNWIAANGQSCVGTAYSNENKVNTVPNISVAGTNAFIKVN